MSLPAAASALTRLPPTTSPSHRMAPWSCHPQPSAPFSSLSSLKATKNRPSGLFRPPLTLARSLSLSTSNRPRIKSTAIGVGDNKKPAIYKKCHPITPAFQLLCSYPLRFAQRSNVPAQPSPAKPPLHRKRSRQARLDSVTRSQEHKDKNKTRRGTPQRTDPNVYLHGSFVAWSQYTRVEGLG